MSEPQFDFLWNITHTGNNYAAAREFVIKSSGLQDYYFRRSSYYSFIKSNNISINDLDIKFVSQAQFNEMSIESFKKLKLFTISNNGDIIPIIIKSVVNGNGGNNIYFTCENIDDFKLAFTDSTNKDSYAFQYIFMEYESQEVSVFSLTGNYVSLIVNANDYTVDKIYAKYFDNNYSFSFNNPNTSLPNFFPTYFDEHSITITSTPPRIGFKPHIFTRNNSNMLHYCLSDSDNDFNTISRNYLIPIGWLCKNTTFYPNGRSDSNLGNNLFSISNFVMNNSGHIQNRPILTLSKPLKIMGNITYNDSIIPPEPVPPKPPKDSCRLVFTENTSAHTNTNGVKYTENAKKHNTKKYSANARADGGCGSYE